jgi:CHAT domain-containing protein
MLEGRVEQNRYIPDYLTATDAKQNSRLTGPDGSRPVIVLNACQTGRSGYALTGIGGFADAYVKRGAGAFVGGSWSVGDQPARTFTEAWYTALLGGDNLAQATIRAREAARQAGDATWLAYVVYGHPHARLLR